MVLLRPEMDIQKRVYYYQLLTINSNTLTINSNIQIVDNSSRTNYVLCHNFCNPNHRLFTHSDPESLLHSTNCLRQDILTELCTGPGYAQATDANEAVYYQASEKCRDEVNIIAEIVNNGRIIDLPYASVCDYENSN